jgi:hypothetical protein
MCYLYLICSDFSPIVFWGYIFSNIIFSDKPQKLYIFVKRIESAIDWYRIPSVYL